MDVNHFIANMLVAMGVTDEEWEAAYQAKQGVNRQRMASGTYTAQKGAPAPSEGLDVDALVANKTVEVAGHLVVHVAACACPQQQAEVARLSESAPEGGEG